MPFMNLILRHSGRLVGLIVIAALSVLLFSSCGSSYNGYKMGSYSIRGVRYDPIPLDKALYHRERGIASWYNESKLLGLVRGNTAIGEKVYPWHSSGAHKHLPLPCRVKVTNLRNGKSAKIRVNDRGPHIPGRIIDVTPKIAKKLGFYNDGLTEVEIEVISIGDGKHKRKP